jgi:nitroreductase
MNRHRKRLKQAETVAVGCDPLPLNLDGKEGSTVRVRLDSTTGTTYRVAPSSRQTGWSRTTYDPAVDTFLAIVSKRDTRQYADRAISDEVVGRILDAGRLAGSASNRQRWRFLLIESSEVRARLAEAVYEPDNVRGAQLVVAIQSRASLDAGRCVQNMMLAAWNDGVVSCPNGIEDAEKVREALHLAEDDQVAIILTFGYPAKIRDPMSRTPEDWSARANRKPLDELIERVQG